MLELLNEKVLCFNLTNRFTFIACQFYRIKVNNLKRYKNSVLSIPKQIVIVGLNVHSLVSALALRKTYDKNRLSLSIIGKNQPSNTHIAMVAPSQINEMFAHFGVSESEWMAKCDATFKVRNHYIGWGKKPFSVSNHCEVDIYYQPLLMELSRLKREGFDISLHPDDFFFSSALAKQNLAPKGKNFPFKVNYQYQVNTEKLISLLFELATQQHIGITQEDIETLKFDVNKNITLVESSTAKYTADYFLDCSEYQQLLIANMPGYGKSQLTSVRNNDRLLVAKMPSEQVYNETQCTSYESGYIKTLSIKGRQELHYYFSSKFLSDEKAAEALSYYSQKTYGIACELQLLASIDHLTNSPWINNCLALGKAFGYGCPVEDYELALTFSAIDSFVKSIQSDNQQSEIIAAYNQLIKSRYAYSQAFSETLLLLNTRRDSPYWQTPQNQTAFPQIATKKMSQWLAGEDLTVEDITDVIGKFGWYSLFSGLEIYPPNCDKKHPSEQSITDSIDDMRDKYLGCCLNFVPHQATLSGESEHAEY